MIRRLLLLLFALLPAFVQAQVSYTGTPYVQDFNSLLGTTNNTTGVSWTNNSTLPGWYAALTTGAVTTYGVTNGTIGGSVTSFDGTGSSPTTNISNVGLLSFGTAGSMDRALGSRSTSNWTGHGTVAYGVRFVNSTASTITAFNVMFTGEQWHKNGGTTAHTLPLQYRLGATSITDAGTWTAVATFTSPVNTATIATLDGNVSANRTGIAGRVSGISWAPGTELWLRIADGNESGNEQSMGIDDFVFTTEGNSGLFFNGASNHVTMGAATSTLGASAFTLEAWIFRTGTGTTASTGTGGVVAYPMVTKGRGESESSGLNCNYFLGIDASNKLVADFEAAAASGITTGQNYPVTGSSTIPFNQWTHVAATYDGAATDGEKWKLYVNGVKDTSNATAGVNTAANAVPEAISTQHFAIGTAMNSAGAREGTFLGLIDEVRVWNVARSSTQIANDRTTEVTSGTGLLARYGFGEGTGTSAASSVAGAPAGTLVSSPVWMNGYTFIPNTLPTVAITAPSSNASFMAPATVSITADAADSDGTIAKVEFFEGTNKIGEDTTAPYQFDWTRSNAQSGAYSLTAKAIDNGGASSTSTGVSISIMPNSNQPPVITAASPADNATGIGASTTLQVNLADPEGDAMTVSFYGRKTTPVAPGADFSFIAIPDTQFYSQNTGGALYANFTAQTQWIVNNRATRNIAFVSHMGDIVQNGDNGGNPVEWIRASDAMATIENQLTTLRAHGIPWGGAPGNHDIGTGGGTGTTALFNQYMGTARFAGRGYYGGNYGTTNNNNYELFSASGLDFIVLHLEYDTTPDQDVLDWADALLKAHPSRRAIVTSHWVVNTGNPATFSAQGQAIYDNLKDNPNLFLMLCGHVNGEGRRSDVFQSRTVHSVLQDYQDITNGGNGFLRIYTFSPANNTINVESYSPTLNRAVQASDSVPSWTTSFTLPYNMQSAVTDWIPLGTVSVSAGGTSASLDWTGLEAGSDYEWYASATDTINTAGTTARHFSTSANAAPTVAITAPSNNASFTAPATFNLTTDAADSDGSIARVEFYQGTTKFGEDTSAPFAQSISGLLVGSYTFTAVAVDNSGATTLSSVVNVTVNASLPPTVSLTAPSSNASFEAPATIMITADASDADGTVSKVEFFNGAVKLGEDSTAPYSYEWTNVISGSYALTAKATDNADTSSTSSAVSITVANTDNMSPTVAITSPSNNSTVAPGTSLTLNATASDTDGLVTKVEFFDGATLLGEDTSAPYSFTVASLSSGAHDFTAKATDNDNGTTTSSSIIVTADPSLWAYTQDFDSMGTTGTTLPSGWSMRLGSTATSGNAVWTDATGIPASGMAGLAANANALTATTTPSMNNNNGYNAAASAGATSNRVLVTAPTTYEGVAIQLALVNGSGSALNAIRISYDTVRYTAVATANELPGYWLFYSLDNGTTWTNASALNPSLTTVPNTVGTTTLPAPTLSLSSSWATGATMLLRWVDDNAVATSPDQIIGLDNVAITVPVGQPPTVALTAPASGSVSYVGDTITFTADAADSDGSIAKVEFYQGTTKLGEDSTTPYAYDWSGFTAGTYSLTARATDNDSNITASSAASITVNAAPGSGTLTRGPYLNQANHNSIVIRWRSSQSVVGRVRYGTSSTNLDQVINESTAATDHVVKLTGLSPYTRYYYSVGSAFDTLTPQAAETTSFSTGAPAPVAADYTFRTAPTPGEAKPTRVWIVGDCGRGTQVQANGRDAYYAWMGSRVPDLNLQLGDNAYNSGTDTEYQTGYWNMYHNIFRKMPQWSTLGNHDANNGTTNPTTNFPYFDMFTFPTAGECGGVPSGTEHYYSFDYGNIHFICLDSQTTLANSSTSAPQTVWLQSDLASTTATWIVAFFHHPIYSKGSHDSDSESQMVTMRTVYAPILEAGGVDLIFVGHSHNYERSFLMSGHYGTSSTLTASMRKQSGNGSINGFTTSASGVIRQSPSFTATATTAGTVIPGNGAYTKPLTGPRDGFGTVYNTAGMSGLADSGSINHTAMYIGYNQVGTVNLDVDGNTLTCTFVQSGGATPDNFTIVKQGYADSDADGMSDEWELANGLNRFSAADAAQTASGDSRSFLERYLLGVPSGSNSSYDWETSPPNETTGTVDVSFATLPDRKYQVFWSNDLMTWNPASAEIAGDGTTRVWTDDGSATGSLPGSTPDKKRFYRVRVSAAQ